MDLEVLRSWLDRKVEEQGLRFSRQQLVGLAVLAFLIILGAAFLVWRSKPTVQVEKISERPSTSQADGQKQKAPNKPSPSNPSPKMLFIHVAGSVRKPGVYELPEGKRVVDAIAAAGGSAPGAELDALNLAARLTDSQKIFVPKKGQAPPNPTGVDAGLSPADSGSGELIDLNQASLQQLDTLPGVGPVMAQRILEYREAHGGFKSVGELRQVEGIGPKKYDQLKSKVTVP